MKDETSCEEYTPRAKPLADLRELSGDIRDRRHVVSFLYELMRDHLPPGVVSELVKNSVSSEETTYTNGYLAQYAQYLADKLGVPKGDS